MQTLLVGVQLLDYQEPQALAGFCKCLLYFQRQYPEVNISVMTAYRTKEYMAGRQFLTRAKKSNADYFFMTGGDIVLKATTLIRLYERQYPIISGMFVDSKGGYKPFFYRRAGAGLYRYEKQDIIRSIINIENPGSGCLLIKKEVLDKLPCDGFSQYGTIRPGDSAFFERVYETGYRVFIDSDVRVGHICKNKKIYWPKQTVYI